MKTVNIIGAGIAGLSAGCYLQMNGYKTRIFELHNMPGGLCCAWKRGDYTFEGCVHWLVGSNPKSKFYSLWNEVIDMEKMEFFDHEVYATVYDKEKNSISFYTDVDRLESELLAKAPEDHDFIKSFTRSIRKVSKFNMDPSKAEELMGLWDGLKMMFAFLPVMPEYRKWNKKTRDVAKGIKNPLLKQAIHNSFDPDMSFIFMIFTLALMNSKDAGYPIGGSLKLAGEIERRYKELGGEIYYHHRVEKLITEKCGKAERVKSLITEKGEEFEADLCISAADGYHTIFQMLEGRFLDKEKKDYYDNKLTFPSYFQVSLGIDRDLSDQQNTQYFPLQKAIQFDPETLHEHLGMRIFNEDPGLSPEGKGIIILMIPCRNYNYWVDLRKQDREKYRSEKTRIANEVIDAVDQWLGNIKGKVEEMDVSTPASVVRYTNNWKGSFEGWIMSPDTGFKGLKKTLPGLKDFYMTGQWVEPGGGLPTALRSGRNVSQIICKKDRKSFRTTKF